MSEGIIGILNWRMCELCVHCDSIEGGCKLLDENATDILEIDLDSDEVRCIRFRDARGFGKAEKP